MAATPIRGALSAANSRIGTDIPNCRAYVGDLSILESTDKIRFEVLYFWSAAALASYKLDRATRPFDRESFEIPDVAGSARAQAYAYLLTLPKFAGWVQG